MLIEENLIKELEKKLSFEFSDRELLERAFIHPSADQIEKRNYQRLEFLGDQVLGFSVSSILFKKFPDADEGLLSKIRSNLVDEQFLSRLSISLDLGKMLILGRGEDIHGGRHKLSILSDVFESLMAVVFLESGWEAVHNVISELFRPVISRYDSVEDMLLNINRDYKTQLQEICQNHEVELPLYTCLKMEGPEHNLHFTMECSALELVTKGDGKSKKEAEQKAAEKLIKLFREIQKNLES